jgi:uncharacterized protein YqfA (UPF0365 family)
MKTKTVLVTLLALFFLIGGAGCDRENANENIQIKDFSYQGCKEIVTDFTKSAESEESIEYHALAVEQEMKAKAQEARAKVIEAEAQVPLAMAEAFRSGNLGIMDYYKFQNIKADTEMRESISKGTK